MKMGTSGSSMVAMGAPLRMVCSPRRFERGAANLHDAVQLVGLVDAVGPLIDLRMDVGVLVGHVAQILAPRRRRGSWPAPRGLRRPANWR